MCICSKSLSYEKEHFGDRWIAYALQYIVCTQQSNKQKSGGCTDIKFLIPITLFTKISADGNAQAHTNPFSNFLTFYSCGPHCSCLLYPSFTLCLLCLLLPFLLFPFSNFKIKNTKLSTKLNVKCFQFWFYMWSTHL